MPDIGARQLAQTMTQEKKIVCPRKRGQHFFVRIIKLGIELSIIIEFCYLSNSFTQEEAED